MSRPRRHRLHSMALSAKPPRTGTARRFRDEGLAVRALGTQPPPPSRVPAPQVHSFSADPADWGWPAAEPSALSWPAPEDAAATAFSVPLDAPPSPPTPSAPSASPSDAPAARPPASLHDDEADDDVAAILRDNGLAPTQPAPIAAPRPAPAAPPGDDDAPLPVVEDRHAIFGQLGRAMSHANSFQLGRFNFDRHFDMLEEGMSLHPAAAQPPRTVAMANARELHDLDLLSELAAMSEAAGVPLRRDADTDAFMAKVARAQALGMGNFGDDEEAQEDEQAPEEEFASLDATAEENAHSPWSDSQDEAEAEDE